MSKSWKITQNRGVSWQDCDQQSFVGGRPIIPPHFDWPECQICNAEQSFYFQIAFPNLSRFAGRTLAVFACTECAEDDYLIPAMLPGPLKGITIPEGFLEKYQKNFRFLVFPSSEGKLRECYLERVKYSRLEIELSEKGTNFSKIGGDPDWLLSDESPATYNGRGLFFLLQIFNDITFDLVPGAPGAIEMTLAGDFRRSDKRFYELFIGNLVYFFAVADDGAPSIYAITQV